MKLLLLTISILAISLSSFYSATAQSKNDSAIYTITVKLIEAKKIEGFCSCWGKNQFIQKFKILVSSHPLTKYGNVFIEIECPELLGQGFFVTGETYIINICFNPEKKDESPSVILNKTPTFLGYNINKLGSRRVSLLGFVRLQDSANWSNETK